MRLSELRQTKGYHLAGYTAYVGLILGYLDYAAFSGPAAFFGILFLLFLALFVSCVYVWLLAAAKAGRYGMGEILYPNILADIGVIIWFCLCILVAIAVVLDFIRSLFVA
jgi:hypothetical protein